MSTRRSCSTAARPRRRYPAVAAIVAATVVSLGIWVIPVIYSSDFDGAQASAESAAFDRQAFKAQLQAMREMHQRLLTADTLQARDDLIRESDPIMRTGVAMMLRMKATLPASAAGEVRSVVTEPEAELVQDFLLLMRLLVEMKSDTDAVLHPGIHPRAPPRVRDSTPAPQLVHSGIGSSRPEQQSLAATGAP